MSADEAIKSIRRDFLAYLVVAAILGAIYGLWIVALAL